MFIQSMSIHIYMGDYKEKKVRFRAGHQGLNRLFDTRKRKKAEVAAALGMSTVYAQSLFNDPLKFNCRQILIVAAILAVSPEFVLYVIYSNDNPAIQPYNTTTELEDLKFKFLT